jgi:hypothetical protein
MNKTLATTKLPSEGRKGKAPPWPFPEVTPREREIWAYTWKLPQAVMWERSTSLRSVATYVRVQARAELGEMAWIPEARLRETALGITPQAMKSLLWEVVEDEVAVKRGGSDRDEDEYTYFRRPTPA